MKRGIEGEGKGGGGKEGEEDNRGVGRVRGRLRCWKIVS